MSLDDLAKITKNLPEAKKFFGPEPAGDAVFCGPPRGRGCGPPVWRLFFREPETAKAQMPGGRNRENRIRALRPIIENPTCCRASLRPGWLRPEEEQDCNAPRCFGGGFTLPACPPPAAAEKIPLKRRVDPQVCGPPPRKTTKSRRQRTAQMPRAGCGPAAL